MIAALIVLALAGVTQFLLWRKIMATREELLAAVDELIVTVQAVEDAVEDLKANQQDQGLIDSVHGNLTALNAQLRAAIA